MTARKLNKSYKGFTLIELLVVIGILAVLLAITLIAINPARQFSQANDTKRRSDISAILNAVNQYAVDNNGTLPATIPGTATAINSALANFCANLTPTYIAALPVDPTDGTGTALGVSQLPSCTGTWDTGYTIEASATDGRITVEAPGAEVEDEISVTR